MKTSSILIFLMSSALLASCPLGFPPEQACPQDSPSCALYVDGDGDALCDNPGPQPASDSEPSEEILPDTSETVPDSLTVETEPVSDSLPEDAEIPVDTVTWAAESSSTESSEFEDAVEYPSIPEEIVEESLIEFFPDSALIDTVALEETTAPDLTCPLDYSPEQACPEDSPFCAFFINVNDDLYCRIILTV